MPIFERDPTKQQDKEAQRAARRAAAEQSKREVEKQKADEAFAQTPQGRARAAKGAGAKLFQISLPVSATEKSFWGDQALSGSSMMTKTREKVATGELDLIEAEGWELQHVGYVFQPTGTQSRDRLLSSGQVETIVGNVVGIYLFRAV